MMLALNHAEAATRELAVTTLCAQLQDSSVSTRRIMLFSKLVACVLRFIGTYKMKSYIFRMFSNTFVNCVFYR